LVGEGYREGESSLIGDRVVDEEGNERKTRREVTEEKKSSP
jgi:hypothetical protein